MIPPLVLSSPEYAAMADQLCAGGDLERGQVNVKRFPDGERYIRLETSVDGRDVLLLAGTVSDDATLQLYDMACAAAHYGALRITLVIPYFGYSTMERAVHRGEAVTARHRALLLSSIPPAAYGNRVFLVDLHSEGIPHYFEPCIRAVHVYAKAAVHDAIRRVGGPGYALASTDAGRAKWVESLANDLGVDASFVFKRRTSGDTTEVTALQAQVDGRPVVIYDDMIRTGGSLIGAARAYKAAGATEIAAVATHGVLPGDSLKKIQDSGLFTRVVCTDSHPRAAELAPSSGGFLEVLPLAPALAGALRDHP